MREDRKRLLLVAPSLTGGGGERVAATLCQAFADSEGLDVILAVFDAGAAADLGPRVRVRHIAVRERGGAVYTMTKFFKVVLALSLIIRQERPAAILSFMDYCNTVTLLANRLAGGRSRAVISVHTLFSAFLQGKGADVRGRLLKLLADRLYREADAVVAVSRGVATDLVSTFVLPESKISVIGNPIDLHLIGALAVEDVQEPVFIEGGRIILTAGRLAPEKGGRHLVRAFAHVREQIDAKLVFLGEGPEKAELQRLSAELGIERDVFFLGQRENPFAYMAKSTVFALSSSYEGFGNVLIEAMACGLSVISTRCYPGIETLIRDGKTGLLVDVGNERALASAVIRLLADPGLRRELSSQAQKEVWRYDVGEITARYRSVLFPAAPIEGEPSPAEKNESMNTNEKTYTDRLLSLEPVWKRWLCVQLPYRLHLRSLQLGKVLDVGCGIGRNLLNLGGNGIGVDHNANSVSVALSRGLLAYTPADFHASVDARKGSFDAMLLSHVLEHMRRDEAVSLLNEYLPFVRDGGRVVLITPQENGYLSDPSHVEFTDYEALATIAEEAGIRVEKFYSFPFPRFFGRIFRHNEFVVIARKP